VQGSCRIMFGDTTWHLPGRTEENHLHLPGYPVFGSIEAFRFSFGREATLTVKANCVLCVDTCMPTVTFSPLALCFLVRILFVLRTSISFALFASSFRSMNYLLSFEL
jgi:hypothetical protein